MENNLFLNYIVKKIKLKNSSFEVTTFHDKYISNLNSNDLS